MVIRNDAHDQTGLLPDAQFDVIVTSDALLLTPVHRPVRRVIEIDGWPVIEAALGSTTTDADVQRWRDDGQR